MCTMLCFLMRGFFILLSLIQHFYRQLCSYMWSFSTSDFSSPHFLNQPYRLPTTWFETSENKITARDFPSSAGLGLDLRWAPQSSGGEGRKSLPTKSTERLEKQQGWLWMYKCICFSPPGWLSKLSFFLCLWLWLLSLTLGTAA